MSIQPTPTTPNLGRNIADVGRGFADVVFSPFSLLNEGIEDILKRLRINKEDRTLEIPTLQTTARDVKEFFIDYHQRILRVGGRASKEIENYTRAFLGRSLSWLNFFEIGKMVHDIISIKLATLARTITFGAIQVLHTVPYLAASAFLTGTILLFQASPLALLCIGLGAVFSVQLLQSYFLAKGVIRAGNIIQKELDVDKVRDKAELGIQLGAAKVNNWLHEWLQTTRPINWFTTGTLRQRGLAAAATLGALAGIDHFTSPLIAFASIVAAGALLYKTQLPQPQEAQQVTISRGSS